MLTLLAMRAARPDVMLREADHDTQRDIEARVTVHLVDGTYELFRHYFAVPDHRNADGIEVAAARAVVGSMLGMLENGATHLGVATDHVVESFRNELYDGYKTGEGLDPDLWGQFHLLEDCLESLGVAVFAMVEHEADDALAAAAAVAAGDPRTREVLICTPDKDLAQCVIDGRVVQYDRRKRQRINRAAVIDKFGVPPESIPDYLALVGDTADGFPGLPGWGAKSTAAVLARYHHLEAIPADPDQWQVAVRGAKKLAVTLQQRLDDALLFRRLATLDKDAPTIETIDELQWSHPREDFAAAMDKIDAPRLAERARKLAAPDTSQ